MRLTKKALFIQPHNNVGDSKVNYFWVAHVFYGVEPIKNVTNLLRFAKITYICEMIVVT